MIRRVRRPFLFATAAFAAVASASAVLVPGIASAAPATAAPVPAAAPPTASPPAASAPAAPFPFPQTDVTVVYAVPGVPGATQTLRVDAARAIERTDAPGGGLVVITDVAHGTATLLDPTTHVFVREAAPGGAHDPRSTRAPVGTFQPAGDDTIAGEPCTIWRTANGIALCLTADGVTLGVSRDGVAVLRATSVRRAPIDPTWFVLPPDATPAPAGAPPGTPGSGSPAPGTPTTDAPPDRT